LAPKPSRFAVGQEIKDRSLMRPRELVVAWVEAFNRGDPDGMAGAKPQQTLSRHRDPASGDLKNYCFMIIIDRKF